MRHTIIAYTTAYPHLAEADELDLIEEPREYVYRVYVARNVRDGDQVAIYVRGREVSGTRNAHASLCFGALDVLRPARADLLSRRRGKARHKLSEEIPHPHHLTADFRSDGILRLRRGQRT
jgi:hypothetical protein